VDPEVATAARGLVEPVATLGAHLDELNIRIEHPWADGSWMAGRQGVLDEPSAGLAGLDVPQTAREQEWMWKVFAADVPLTATAEFRSLCRRHLGLLTPPSQLTYGSGAAPIDIGASLPDVEGLRRRMDDALSRFDVICSPTMATVAPLAPPGWASPYGDLFMGTNFTFIANSTGCPVASIPCGLVDGLPAGLQVIGRPGDEPTVLRVCQALQGASPPFPRPPIG
jgi:Asp-tRNA(Asn)/Glu-tRNA(Gln) amidotransferase A subunit family amidase